MVITKEKRILHDKSQDVKDSKQSKTKYFKEGTHVIPSRWRSVPGQ